jgi:hypothetical protein
VAELSGQADAHRVVGPAELHHVDALDREDRLEILDRVALLDHECHDRVLERLDERRPADVDHEADVAPHADPVVAAGLRRLGPDAADAFLRVGDRADVGEEEILDPGADRTDGEIAARLLLDLHHAGHVREDVDCAPKVLEGVEVVRRVLADEFDVVERAGVADELRDRRP